MRDWKNYRDHYYVIENLGDCWKWTAIRSNSGSDTFGCTSSKEEAVQKAKKTIDSWGKSIYES